MQAIIKDALVLEVSHATFEKTEDGIKKQIPYSKLVIYEFGQRYPQSKLLKLPQSLIPDATKLVGKKSDLLVKVFQKDKKMELTFEGSM